MTEPEDESPLTDAMMRDIGLNDADIAARHARVPLPRMTLLQMREAAGLTREALAERAELALDMVELLEDMPLNKESFTRRAVAGLGGVLEFHVVFPDGRRVVLVDP